MKQVILCLSFLIAPILLWSQLYLMSDHYVHNSLAINPSFAGSQDALNINFLHRKYWEFFEGSPRTISLSAHAPFYNERIGLGLFLMNDRIGVTNETSLISNFAYRMSLGYGKLAFGLGFGMTYNNTNWGNLAAQDSNDDLLANNTSTGLMPDFSIGLYYSTQKYFMGLSLPLFLSHNYDNFKDKYVMSNDFKAYNYFFKTGYIYSINSTFQLLPSLLFKYHALNPIQIDINTQIIYRNKICLGTTYRSKNIIVGMFQYQVNNQLKIGYSYDFSLGKLGHINNNTYEIMINYVFNYNVEVAGPRHF